MHNPTRRPRTALVSAVALTATGLVAAALAVAPAGVAAQAPAHVPAHLPAHSAALAPAAAASSTSVSTRWSWANGTKITARKVSAAALPASGYYLKVLHNQGENTIVSAVLPNGNGLGLDVRGRLWEFTKTGPKSYTKGTQPYGLMWVQAVGTAAYAVNNGGTLYRLDGPHAAAKRLTTLPEWGGSGPVISGGRIYWTQYRALDGGKQIQSTVVSRSLAGGSIRTEAVGARNPQATDAGVLAVAVLPKTGSEDYAAQSELSGIVKLSGGKAVPFLKFNGVALPSQIGDGTWWFNADGHTLTLPTAGTNGQLVINLRTKKAWNVPSARGTVPSWSGVSGSLAVWRDSRVSGAPVSNKVYVFDVDRGTLRTIAAKMDTPTPVANGRALGWTYSRSGGVTEYQSVWVK